MPPMRIRLFLTVGRQRQLEQALWISPKHVINLPFWSTLT